MEDYRVQLDFYDGPMDLLLYLVRRNEVDIHDIPIARITDQYCQYVTMLRAIDINLAGEFMVMTAWLIEIKTRMLLPAPPPEQAEGQEQASAAEALADPRAELVRQLLAYKQFKDLADELGEAAAEQALKFPRAGIDWEQLAPGADESAVDLADVQIWDLFEAFGRLMDATGRVAVHQVTYDDTPIYEHEADIVERLTAAGTLPFERLFEGRDRGQIIGLFLALLELIRQKRIRFRQDRPFGTIVLSLRSEAPPVESPPGQAEPAETHPPVRKGGRRPKDAEPIGVTWVPEEEEESSDLTLRAIDRELKAIQTGEDLDQAIKPAEQPGQDAQSTSDAISPAPNDETRMTKPE